MSEQIQGGWDDLHAWLLSTASRGVKLGLEEVSATLRALGAAPPDHLVVLIAGTNGKGSSAAAIAHTLATHGVRTGLFTSPHLIDVRERWRVDGRPIAPEAAARALAPFWEAEPPGGAGRAHSFFELTLLGAVAAFGQAEVEVGVYEIGLGGRLDAANALDADVALIATLGYDHQEYLGDTLGAIAAEKLAIVRPGTDVVVGRQRYAEADRVVESARSGAPWWRYGAEFWRDDDSIALPGRRLQVRDWGAMRAPFQRDAAAAGLAAALRVLVRLGRALDPERARRAIATLRWPGRFERRPIAPGRSALLDAAHNADASASLKIALARQGARFGEVIFAGLRDKPIAQMAADLWEATSAPLSLVELSGPRALPLDELAEAVGRVPVRRAGTLARIWREVVERGSGDLLVAGSIHLLGAVLKEGGVSPDELTIFDRGAGR